MYKSNIFTACFIITLMLDCAHIMAQPPRLNLINGVQTIKGPDTAAYLTMLYNRTFDNCNKLDSRPAFLCSGVTLRLTIKAPNRESLRARALLAAMSPGYADKVFHDHNELIIKAWPKGQPNALPILAFFYVNGFSDGLADARYNQCDYCNSTNPKILIPIIRLTPTLDLNGNTYFTYYAADQVGCG